MTYEIKTPYVVIEKFKRLKNCGKKIYGLQ